MELEDLEYILDHYKSPRNYGELKDPDISHEMGNPVCGDEIHLDLKLENNVIKDIRFSAKGCTISQAAASMLTEEVINKDLKYIDSLDSDEMFKIIKVEVSPIRYDCALLALKVLKTAIQSFLKNKHKKT
ncbi:MAG: Fe-S cluster assembly sulfur transfer protein SufU [Thermodesulfobacteriota bacterium]